MNKFYRVINEVANSMNKLQNVMTGNTFTNRYLKLMVSEDELKDFGMEKFRSIKGVENDVNVYSRGFDIDEENYLDKRQISVYLHGGGYVEFREWYEHSYIGLDLALDVVKNGKNSKWHWRGQSDYYSIELDPETGEMRDRFEMFDEEDRVKVDDFGEYIKLKERLVSIILTEEDAGTIVDLMNQGLFKSTPV